MRKKNWSEFNTRGYLAGIFACLPVNKGLSVISINQTFKTLVIAFSDSLITNFNLTYFEISREINHNCCVKIH